MRLVPVVDVRGMILAVPAGTSNREPGAEDRSALTNNYTPGRTKTQPNPCQPAEPCRSAAYGWSHATPFPTRGPRPFEIGASVARSSSAGQSLVLSSGLLDQHLTESVLVAFAKSGAILVPRPTRGRNAGFIAVLGG